MKAVVTHGDFVESSASVVPVGVVDFTAQLTANEESQAARTTDEAFCVGDGMVHSELIEERSRKVGSAADVQLYVSCVCSPRFDSKAECPVKQDGMGRSQPFYSIR